MATKEEIQQRIIKAIVSKLGKYPVCPMCGHNTWNVGTGYVVTPAVSHPTQTVLGGQVYPMVPLICSNCGNTHLFNLLLLGFTSNDWDSLRLDVDG